MPGWAKCPLMSACDPLKLVLVWAHYSCFMESHSCQMSEGPFFLCVCFPKLFFFFFFFPLWKLVREAKLLAIPSLTFSTSQRTVLEALGFGKLWVKVAGLHSTPEVRYRSMIWKQNPQCCEKWVQPGTGLLQWWNSESQTGFWEAVVLSHRSDHAKNWRTLKCRYTVILERKALLSLLKTKIPDNPPPPLPV